MNKKDRKFLVPLAALASILISGNASASQPDQAIPSEINQTVSNSISEFPTSGVHDPFKFILVRNSGSLMVSDHYSHESHASHASHASHRSHYSGN